MIVALQLGRGLLAVGLVLLGFAVMAREGCRRAWEAFKRDFRIELRRRRRLRMDQARKGE